MLVSEWPTLRAEPVALGRAHRDRPASVGAGGFQWAGVRLAPSAPGALHGGAWLACREPAQPKARVSQRSHAERIPCEPCERGYGQEERDKAGRPAPVDPGKNPGRESAPEDADQHEDAESDEEGLEPVEQLLHARSVNAPSSWTRARRAARYVEAARSAQARLTSSRSKSVRTAIARSSAWCSSLPGTAAWLPTFTGSGTDASSASARRQPRGPMDAPCASSSPVPGLVTRPATAGTRTPSIKGRGVQQPLRRQGAEPGAGTP